MLCLCFYIDLNNSCKIFRALSSIPLKKLKYKIDFVLWKIASVCFSFCITDPFILAPCVAHYS